ncbi:MAG: helicase-related protein [Candidatus Woesearchaeota archaeon]
MKIKKEVVKIEEKFEDNLLDIIYDTVKLGKQALVFVNTKQRAEKTAELIAKNLKLKSEQYKILSDEVLNVLPRPTKQCEKLAYCLKSGIAFHHSGLVAKQRHLIEENFRSGIIKVICCTPTLAFGVDLPAFRVIVRDLKRYSLRGMTWIPVLEVQQMFGRAGRPKYDSEGQAICFANSESEIRDLVEHFILGEPEEIYSKLAVEPVFRTYLLSLISTNITRTKSEIYDFFKKTFWAFQFGDFRKIEELINKNLVLLKKWDFITSDSDDFKTAFEFSDEEKFRATLLGKRVAELYLDPLTARYLIKNLLKKKEKTEFSFLQLCTHTLELRPYLNVKVREFEDYEELLTKFQDEILEEIPNSYDEEYDDFLNAFKTAMVFYDWINEIDEEYLLEKYSIRPGELHSKIEILDWLLYACHEIAVILKLKSILTKINKTRLRLRYGVKEELLPLLKVEGIGRIRARKLYNNNIKTISDLKKTPYSILSKLLGEKTALKVKEQIDADFKNTKDKENIPIKRFLQDFEDL